MKNRWRAFVIVAALSVVFGNAGVALAQQVPMAGAYGKASTTDPEVVAAAGFAVKARARATGAPVRLLSIESAEVQVVAGLNYKLRLRVAVKGKTGDVTAVVYKNLQRKYALSSWKAESLTANNSSASSARTIQQLEDSLGVAFMNKTMASLDVERPYLGRVRIVIEHSLASDNDRDRFEIKDFKSLALGEQWLKSRERDDGTPIRETRTLQNCKRGLCTYDFDGGIQHNHLYLKKLSYGMRNGRPYIRTIYLLDGD